MNESEHVLVGERVALDPLRRNLAESCRRSINDLEVRRGLVNVRLYALQAEEAWLDDAIARNAGLDPSRRTSPSTTSPTARRWAPARCSSCRGGWTARRSGSCSATGAAAAWAPRPPR